MSPLDSRLPMTTYLDGEIRGGRHHMRVRVYYEDTDLAGLCITPTTCASWSADAPIICG